MADPENFTRVAAVLCRIAGQIQTLQKYRDDAAKRVDPSLDPELVKRDGLEEVEEIRRLLSAEKEPKRAADPIINRRNYFPKNL